VAAVLQRLRDEVFHHSKLPRLVARGNLERMEAAVNAQLKEFGSPFWVRASETLGFTAHLPGKPPRPVESLSGGQQGVFAFAYRAALGSRFAVDAGMLALDEPTDGLDAANVAYLRDALAGLAGRVRGSRQVFVVSHSEALLPAFDHVVRFGGGS
jgi:ATPase subunit of ABC transporter with duplicated ATPase domains